MKLVVFISLLVICIMPLTSLEFVISEKKQESVTITPTDGDPSAKQKSIDDVLGIVKKVDDVDAKLKELEVSKELNNSTISKSNIAGNEMVTDINTVESNMKDLSTMRSELTPEQIQAIRKDEEMKISEIKLAIANLSETNLASPQTIDKLNTELKQRETKLAELDTRLAEFDLREKNMELRLNELKQDSFLMYTIKSGDYLSKISKRPEYMGQGALWPLIYRYNKDLIKDPDLIMPGWKIKIPIRWYITTPEDTTLFDLAQKIYGTREKWLWLSWANAQIVKDPKKLQPGLRLKIPLE